MSNFETLQKKITDWALERDLLHPENNSAQLIKVGEEVGELFSAHNSQNTEEIKDALGDILITLIIYAEQRGFNLVKCLRHAYFEIKDRQGKTINGTFIKNK